MGSVLKYTFTFISRSDFKVPKKLIIKREDLHNILPLLIGEEGTDSSGMCVAREDPTGA
jgi:hypothetical protein